MNKFVLTVVGVVLPALALAGCGSDAPRTQPSKTPSPSATAPAWKSSYTAGQIADYNAALAAFNAIETREAAIWANPSRYTTARVRPIFDEDWSNTTRPLHQFQSYVSNGIRVSGLPSVLSSRPGTVAPNSGGSGLEQITIRQCVDGSMVRATQNGVRLRSSTTKRGVRVVEMFKTPGGRYLLFQVGEGSGSC